MQTGIHKILVLTAAVAFSLTANATMPIDSLSGIGMIVKKVDRVLDRRDERNRQNVDTAFLQRAPERLRLRLLVNASGSVITARGSVNGSKFKSTLEAQNKYTVCVGASYRGLTLSAALNPASLTGKNKDYEFNLNAYGNRIGADVIFQSANTFKGNIETDHGNTDIGTGLIRMNMLRLNAYYALNACRFSYPAAFSQSWIQRKSSGSLMLGTSFVGGNVRVGHSDDLGNKAMRLSIANIGIGVGYGYNFVIKQNWLIHLSSVPELVVFSRCRQTIEGHREKAPYRFPNIIAVGRMAVVRHFDRYFTGMTVVVNTSSTGDSDQLRLNTVKWRARLFFGVKL